MDPTIAFSALFDAAAIWGLWTLGRRVVLGRAGTARHRVRAAERELETVLRSSEDVLPQDAREALASAVAGLRQARRTVRDAAGASAAVKKARFLANATEEALPPRRVPPAFREAVETIVVAFGVALAVRAYFFQPFKIPTGSMQPTLYGIHAEDAEGPGFFDTAVPLKILKWAVTGRWYRDVVAHRDGTLAVWSDHVGAPGYILASLAGETYKIPQDALERHENALLRFSDLRPDDPTASRPGALRGTVHKGDRLWRGYVVSGDQVFVNRFLWYLRPPKRDEIVVFATSASEHSKTGKGSETMRSPAPGKRTLHVPFFGFDLAIDETPIPGLQPGMFYIKRLVGLPGERVTVDPPQLVIDGKPVSGFPGIDRESSRVESRTGPKYAGYHATGDAELGRNRNPAWPMGSPGDEIAVGDAYLPMGDNTCNSFDGRYWGPVPRPQMLGPAACVYWPLSVRWGRVW